MRTLFRVHNKANLAIALSFLLFAAFFALRGFLTLSEDSLTDFMAAGLIHSVSVFVYELIVVITSFGMVWIVSYKVQRVLAKQASHDPLTKVLNRRALEEIVNTEHSRSLRNGVPLSIIMLDIDHFKLINDRYGHGRGDDVLVEIANILVENTRQYDCIARFGGEEFIILLPNTSLNEANIIAEGLRLKIAEYEFDLNTEGCLKVTASFGVSEFDLLKDGWLNVLERADSGLYEAKETGRNKVIVFNSNNQDA
jgi:diguanylate cyclase (GGDEF)-like protein